VYVWVGLLGGREGGREDRAVFHWMGSVCAIYFSDHVQGSIRVRYVSW